VLNRRAFQLSVFAAAMAALHACARESVQARLVPAGASVLALGDSITFGTGAAPEQSYPAVLAQLTGWNVINAGVPGHVSAQSLERLPALLQEHQPALVLLGIGGNDFLRRMPQTQTQANIQKLAEQVVASGAQLLLIAIPEPSLAAAFTGSLSDHPMYAEIAQKLKVPLLRGAWAEVLSDESLRSDNIHANAKGYALFARRLVGTAHAVGLLAKP
jgi:acyl-CoA thioesterase I